ncbi:MAG: hypothetical protein L3K04_07340 [Thermoplasmata archaeon]|nr:hypothetical protein [Thermoplasmata archaeon]MCI4341051.1 hypothetical protein [Thermoplasmata archaeon]
MAKKGRQKIEERESTAFEFPVFDERAFIRHELDLSWATAIALAVSVLIGLASAAIVQIGVSFTISILVGVLGIVAIPSIIGAVRTTHEEYTKGDWAGVIAVAVFVWLGVWFLLSGLL